MIRAFKLGLIIELTNRKNFFALLIVALTIFGCMFYVQSQSVGNSVVEKTGDYYAAQVALSKFQVLDASANGDGSDLYKNLTQQKSAVALQIAALKVVQDELYFETSLRLADLREVAFDLEDYDKVAYLMSSRIENKMNQLYYSFLLDNDQSFSPNVLQYFPFLLFFFSIVGAGWYVFVSFHTSSIMLDDFEHSSIIKGYPISFVQYIFTKCLTSLLYIVLFIGLIFICTLPLLFMNGAGDAGYPVVLYNGEPAIYEAGQYIAICVVSMVAISIFVMLLSIILNVLLKNMYLTLFVHIILFFLPTIFPSLISLLPFNPLHFMNFNQLLNGYPLELKEPVDLTMNMGLIVILISIVLMMLLIKTFFSTGKISRV